MKTKRHYYKVTLRHRRRFEDDIIVTYTNLDLDPKKKYNISKLIILKLKKRNKKGNTQEAEKNRRIYEWINDSDVDITYKEYTPEYIKKQEQEAFEQEIEKQEQLKKQKHFLQINNPEELHEKKFPSFKEFVQ